jgi:hypothetical protein
VGGGESRIAAAAEAATVHRIGLAALFGLLARQFSQGGQLSASCLPKTSLAFSVGPSFFLRGLRRAARSKRQRKIDRWRENVSALECQWRADERERSQRPCAAFVEEGILGRAPRGEGPLGRNDAELARQVFRVTGKNRGRNAAMEGCNRLIRKAEKPISGSATSGTQKTKVHYMRCKKLDFGGRMAINALQIMHGLP